VRRWTPALASGAGWARTYAADERKPARRKPRILTKVWDLDPEEAIDGLERL
jgi:hypothetical protein